MQGKLKALGIDGWLLYDFHKKNSLALDFLAVSSEYVGSRRFFYWIPQEGEPVKIVHEIEKEVLDHLPGKKCIYLRWETLHGLLQTVLSSSRKVAMEYSPDCSIPYISKIDGGTLDLVRKWGAKVVSSDVFLQEYICTLTPSQRGSLREASLVAQKAFEVGWEAIEQAIVMKTQITDWDVQQRIVQFFEKNGMLFDHAPICSVNASSASPHFIPSQERPVPIREGDFVLIDLWCKKNAPGSVYVDLTKVAVVGREVPEKIAHIFGIVRKAQEQARKTIAEAFKGNIIIRGCDVDKVCRQVIVSEGYGEFFTHRTGHNIYTEVHGPGTHLDDLETHDDRPLFKGSCYSIEPGIYLPGEFGLRLEYNIYIDERGAVEVIGGQQDRIKTFF